MAIFTLILICILVFASISAVIGLIAGIIALSFKLIFWLIPIIFVGAIIVGIPFLKILAIIKLLR